MSKVADTSVGNETIVPVRGGAGGVVDTVVAGNGITVDSTNPTAPVVSAGMDVVEGVAAGTGITVDNTDPHNPVVAATARVVTVVAGTNVAVDNTDPTHPVVSTLSTVESVVAGANVTVDNTDPRNPVVAAAGGGGAINNAAAVIGGDVGIGAGGTNIVQMDNAPPGVYLVTIHATFINTDAVNPADVTFALTTWNGAPTFHGPIGAVCALGNSTVGDNEQTVAITTVVDTNGGAWQGNLKAWAAGGNVAAKQLDPQGHAATGWTHIQLA